MSGIVDGSAPSDLWPEPQATAPVEVVPNDAETKGLQPQRSNDEVGRGPGDEDAGELADGPLAPESADRPATAADAGGLAVAATATFGARHHETAAEDRDDQLRIPAQAAGQDGTIAETGPDSATALPADTAERSDRVQPAGDVAHAEDEQRSDAEVPEAAPETAESPVRPARDTGHNAIATTFGHMSGAEITQWRDWAEATAHRASDYTSTPQQRMAAQYELKTNGTGRFMEHFREAEAETFGSRRSALEDLEDTGFSGQQIHDLRSMIAASGLPTHALTEFVHEPDIEAVDANGNSGGQVIASMHTQGEHRGRFTVHDCFDEAPEEEKKATVVHEMTHNLSALRPENNEIFGEGEAGEQARLEIAEYVSRVVDQSLLTGVHLNGYHKHLLQEYNETKRILDACRNLPPDVVGQHVTQQEYEEHLAAARYKLAEETQAILTEMSFFKRAELERVQADQAQKLEDIARVARNDPESELLPESIRGLGINGVPERVDLVTNQAARGQAAEGVGADRIAITLLRNVGVNNYDDLMRHINNFKGNEWGNGSPRVQRQVAQARERGLEYTRQFPPRQL